MLPKNPGYLTVPVEIIELANNKGYLKPLAIYLYLKLFVGDKVSHQNKIFDQLCIDLKMTDSRTFNKHISVLLSLNWIGYNKTSKIYHIRAFNYLRTVHELKSCQACITKLDDILQIQLYAIGVIINYAIRKQIYFQKRAKGILRTATKKGPVAKQSKVPRRSSILPYCGLSNRGLAKILRCKQTRACNLKNEAAKAGYLKNKHRYQDITILTKPDYLLRPTIFQGNQALANRVRFFSKKKGGDRRIIVVQQLRDEIIPLMAFKNVSGFNKVISKTSKVLKSK